jgi:hypothetical protein
MIGRKLDDQKVGRSEGWLRLQRELKLENSVSKVGGKRSNKIEDRGVTRRRGYEKILENCIGLDRDT